MLFDGAVAVGTDRGKLIMVDLRLKECRDGKFSLVANHSETVFIYIYFADSFVWPNETVCQRTSSSSQLHYCVGRQLQ